MHELGVIVEIIRTVEEVVRTNNLTKVDALVLQVGELSSMVPKYIEECYPAAADGTLLQETKLIIEIIPGNGRCGQCQKVFNVLATNNACPTCGAPAIELLSGKEFVIKEIVAC